MDQFRLSHLIMALSVVGIVAGGAWLLTADGAMDAGFHPSHPVIFAGVVGLVLGGLRLRAEGRRANARTSLR